MQQTAKEKNGGLAVKEPVASFRLFYCRNGKTYADLRASIVAKRNLIRLPLASVR